MKEYLAEPHVRRFHDLLCCCAQVRALVDEPRLGISKGDLFDLYGESTYRGITLRAAGARLISARYEGEGKFWEVVE